MNVLYEKKNKRNKDKVYCDLIKLACLTERKNYDIRALDQAVYTLNQLPSYKKIHKRIIPLLNGKANTLDIYHKLNAEVQFLLKRETQKAVVTELAKEKQLERVLDVLKDENISIILLKGVVFNKWLYSKEYPRTSNDIDLLVKEKDWSKAKALISNIMHPVTRGKGEIFDDLYESSFIPREKVGAVIDLHKSLIHPFIFNVDEVMLWENSVIVPHYSCEKIRMLSPEYSLLHLAIHAFKDMNYCKYNVVDSNEIIMKKNINMESVIKIAKSWGAEIPLFYLLQYQETTIGLDIYSDQLKKIEPLEIKKRTINWLLNSICEHSMKNSKPIKYRIYQVAAQFLFSSRWRGVIRLQLLYLLQIIKLKIFNFNVRCVGY